MEVQVEVERFSSLLESLSKATCLEGQLAGQIETRLDDSRVAQSSRSATAAVHRMSGSSNATRLSENVRKSKDGSTRNLLFPDGFFELKVGSETIGRRSLDDTSSEEKRELVQVINKQKSKYKEARSEAASSCDLQSNCLPRALVG